uniref:Uncharacterized protein n=1 Tax=Dulem virus 149 TaxID=3145626 RepID=A0AAU8AY72_9VIRU
MTKSTKDSDAEVSMCGLFEYVVHTVSSHSPVITIFASSVRGALGKISRLVARRDDYKAITVVVVHAKHAPDICFKRFYESGSPLSPWLRGDTPMNEV